MSAESDEIETPIELPDECRMCGENDRMDGSMVCEECSDDGETRKIYIGSPTEAPGGAVVGKDGDGLFFRRFEKERRYVDSPEEVPEGYEPQQGERGGWYYETEGESGDTEEPESDQSGAPESVAAPEGEEGGDEMVPGDFETTEFMRNDDIPDIDPEDFDPHEFDAEEWFEGGEMFVDFDGSRVQIHSVGGGQIAFWDESVEERMVFEEDLFAEQYEDALKEMAGAKPTRDGGLGIWASPVDSPTQVGMLEEGDTIFLEGDGEEYTVAQVGKDGTGHMKVVIDDDSPIPTVVDEAQIKMKKERDALPIASKWQGKIETEFGERLAHGIYTHSLGVQGESGFVTSREFLTELSAVKNLELVEEALKHEVANRGSKTAIEQGLAPRMRALGGDPEPILGGGKGDGPGGSGIPVEQTLDSLDEPWGNRDNPGVGTYYSNGIENREEWEEIWDKASSDDLQEWLVDNSLDAYIEDGRLHIGSKRRLGEHPKENMVASMLALRDDTEIDIEDVFIFDIDLRRSGDIGREEMKDEVSVFMNSLNPVVAAGVLTHTGFISNEMGKSSANGFYRYSDRGIRVKTKMGRRHPMHDSGSPSVVNHELAHSLHCLFGLTSNGNGSESFSDINPWDGKTDFGASEEVSELHERLKEQHQRLYDSFHNETDEVAEVRPYEKYNALEFFTTTFTAWMRDRPKLEKRHPEMAEIFEDFFDTASGWEEVEPGGTVETGQVIRLERTDMVDTGMVIESQPSSDDRTLVRVLTETGDERTFTVGEGRTVHSASVLEGERIAPQIVEPMVEVMSEYGEGDTIELNGEEVGIMEFEPRYGDVYLDREIETPGDGPPTSAIGIEEFLELVNDE